MLVLVLAFTSGFIDVISFLGFNVFASVMTANTVLLGLAIGSGNIINALGSVLALVGYIGGVALCARIVEPESDPQKNMAKRSYEGPRHRSFSTFAFSNWGIFRWR
jgi:uncharacterized membrane protein YoaK (UPF0700 family)